MLGEQDQFKAPRIGGLGPDLGGKHSMLILLLRLWRTRQMLHLIFEQLQLRITIFLQVFEQFSLGGLEILELGGLQFLEGFEFLVLTVFQGFELAFAEGLEVVDFADELVNDRRLFPRKSILGVNQSLR